MKTTYKGKSHKEILNKIYAKALTLLNENKIEPLFNLNPASLFNL